MTRSEAKGYGVYSIRGDALSDRMVKVFRPKEYDYVIDKIFDDFESRVCGSCKHWSQEDRLAGICTLNDCFKKVDNYKDYKQYCSEWESKDE